MWEVWAVESVLTRRIDDLLAKGERVIASEREPPPLVVMVPQVDWQLFSEWQTQSLSFLTSTLGRDHVCVDHFRSRVEKPWADHVRFGQGILRGLREDIEKGHLRTLRELVHAEVFSDFLEMAGYLLSEGYKDPAAVMVGGVLEEHLRQLCRKNGVDIEVQARTGFRPKRAEAMNTELVKAGAYSILDQKNVTAWLDLRNKAAHGKYGEYSAEQVELLLRAVTDFLARFPA